MRKKISDEEADKLLEEQYIREAEAMEAGLLPPECGPFV